MTDGYNPHEYLPTIDVSVKRIRNAVQELFAVDLQPHKAEINDIILERYYKLVEDRKNGSRKLEDDRARAKKVDKTKASKLSKGSVKEGTKKRSAKAKTKDDTSKSSRNAFFREQLLSPQLADVLGVEKSSRPQVVKSLWSYIKDNSLQDPEDKRRIRCDDKLKAVFKKETVGAFEMNKILSEHLTKIEDENEQKGKPLEPSVASNEIGSNSTNSSIHGSELESPHS